MNKFLAFLALCLVVLAPFSVMADMDSEPFSTTVIGATTNTRTIVVRGMLEGVKVDITAGQTCSVAVASAQLTLFSKSGIAADATYLPRAAVHSTAGAAITFVGGTNDTANVWYDKQPMAGAVTVTTIGESAGTNAVITTLIYSR